VAEGIAEFSRLDIVCVNAGISGGGRLWELTERTRTHALSVRVVGPVDGSVSHVSISWADWCRRGRRRRPIGSRQHRSNEVGSVCVSGRNIASPSRTS
jgi:hypothetical protein